MSNAQRKYFSRKGTQVEATVAYTPKQIGVTESFNRTLAEMARAMLIDAKSPVANDDESPCPVTNIDETLDIDEVELTEEDDGTSTLSSQSEQLKTKVM